MVPMKDDSQEVYILIVRRDCRVLAMEWNEMEYDEIRYVQKNVIRIFISIEAFLFSLPTRTIIFIKKEDITEIEVVESR